MARLTGVAAAAAACLAVTMAAVVSLAGCTPASGAASSTASGPSSLTSGIGPITFAIGSDDISWLTPVLNAWNASHPGQRVTPLYLPEAANDQLAQLVANLQAKSDAYDVIDLDVVWTAEFASAGWIIPLPAGKFPLGDFLPPAVATAEYQGRLYAIPYYSNADLLYYRSDILKQARQKPPATWAQLQSLATKVAPKYHLDGYAATLAPYEGLTVNFAESVQSAGGSILSPDGTEVTVDSPQAVTGLAFLVNGLRQGWIPSADLGYEEVSAQQAFEAGKFLFLNDWPDVYAAASQPGPGNTVVGKFGVVALPGLNGPGSSSLGGANLAISAYSQHQRTALEFISYLTDLSNETAMLTSGGFPPVWKQIYSDPSLRKQFPYLPVLEQAIDSAQPRPVSADYDQASLVISSAVQAALRMRETPQQALSQMASQLAQIIQ
ncbi:MAG TPA: ABC transporter substrate-binding protein [Streptosporangiaceae bacterium]|nr:ABC transporter substrate-binding protein [Streptosporangiaceae bacterium]